MARPDIPSARWVGLPRGWGSGRSVSKPTVVFIHTTEGSEGRDSAENGAAYDKSRTDGTSCHLFVDQDSIAQEVEFKDTAYAALWHGNQIGIHIEVCGRAGQSAAQWNDAASAGTITKLIRACYEIRKLYGQAWFPLVNLTPSGLRNGQRGFAEHLDATLAWPEDGGDHGDPGPNFPWGKLFQGIQALEDEEDEVALESDMITLSKDTAVAAYTAADEGKDKPASQLLSLALIHAARANKGTAQNKEEIEELKEQNAQLNSKLDRILAAVAPPTKK